MQEASTRKIYDIHSMFYDATFGRLVKRRIERAIHHMNISETDLVLDLGIGTGVSLNYYPQHARVTGVDLSAGMLRKAREKIRERQLSHANVFQADALRLPYADACFDAVAISFGLRNVEDPAAALRELRRVTRPGGTLVVCEFSTPTWAPFRSVYVNYLVAALPRIARLVSSNPAAYEYLAESIQAWPDQPALAATIAAAGWTDVEWRNLTGGIVALHRARAG